MLKINSQNHSELIVLYPLSVVCSEHQHTQVKMISALTHWIYISKRFQYTVKQLYTFFTQNLKTNPNTVLIDRLS